MHDTPAFERVQARLAQMAPAPTTEQAARDGAATGTSGSVPDSRPDPGRVPPPASATTTYNEGNLFRIAVPTNWREVPGSNSVTFAPEGAYGTVNQQGIFTHGVEAGVVRNASGGLEAATTSLIDSLARANPRLGRPAGYDRVTIGGATGLRTTLSNVSDATGASEQIAVYTTRMPDGTLFYLLGVAPAGEFSHYQGVFRRVADSIRFAR